MSNLICEAQQTYIPVIGGSDLIGRHPVGWEAIRPKVNSKPGYLTAAILEEKKTWAEYLEAVDYADPGTLEQLHDEWYLASLACKQAWLRYEDPEYTSIPF